MSTIDRSAIEFSAIELPAALTSPTVPVVADFLARARAATLVSEARDVREAAER